MLKVRDKQCETCIYTPRTPVRATVEELEAEVADERCPGFFKGSRLCHYHEHITCRGFWNRHKDKFTAGQVAQRLNMVEFTTED